MEKVLERMREEKLERAGVVSWREGEAWGRQWEREEGQEKVVAGLFVDITWGK